MIHLRETIAFILQLRKMDFCHIMGLAALISTFTQSGKDNYKGLHCNLCVHCVCL